MTVRAGGFETIDVELAGDPIDRTLAHCEGGAPMFPRAGEPHAAPRAAAFPSISMPPTFPRFANGSWRRG